MLSITLLFAVLILLEGVQQGPLVWVLTEFVPDAYHGVPLGKYTGIALHFVAVVAYLVVVAWVGFDHGLLLHVNFWLTAVVLRVVLFDVALNLTRNLMQRRFGRTLLPLFAVGTSSFTDKLIQALAARLRWKPTLVSGAARALALVALCWLL